MRNANMIWAVPCAVALATACSSSSSNNAAETNDGGADGSSADDATTSVGDDGGGSSMMMATITCMGPADCGGAGHSCCYSTTTNATMCRTGTCGTDYTQCSGSDSDCPAGDVCIVSPLGATVHYCVAGDGGAASGDSGTSTDSSTTDGSTPSEGGTTDSGSDASSDGPTE